MSEFESQNPLSHATPDSGEATSSQPPTPIVYGGFWRRWLAAFIDNVFTFLVSLPFNFIAGGDFTISSSVAVLLFIIYNTVFLSSPIQTTPGKSIMGLAVVHETSLEGLTFKAALIRTISTYVSSMVLLLGYLIQPFTAKRQTLHDMFASCVVIRRASNENINYIKVFTTQFKKLIE